MQRKNMIEGGNTASFYVQKLLRGLAPLSYTASPHFPHSEDPDRTLNQQMTVESISTPVMSDKRNGRIYCQGGSGHEGPAQSIIQCFATHHSQIGQAWVCCLVMGQDQWAAISTRRASPQTVIGMAVLGSAAQPRCRVIVWTVKRNDEKDGNARLFAYWPLSNISCGCFGDRVNPWR